MVEKQEQPKQEPKRKKRRDVGSYACSSCPKVFTRSDHLARHYLNHQPKEVYVCDYVITSHKGLTRTCGKTFVRKDLRERHYRRHLIDKPEEEAEISQDTDARPNGNAASLEHSTPPEHGPTLQYPEIKKGIDGPKVAVDNRGPHLIQNPAYLQNPHNLSHPGFQGTAPGFQGNPLHKHLPYPQPVQGQNSPLSQVYPNQPLQPTYAPPLPVNVHELPHPEQPRFQNGKPYSYAVDDLHPLDPNTVNPHDIMRSYMPQSQNDILSWLFLESPDSARIDLYLVNMGSTPASMASDFPGNGVPSPVTPYYPNNISVPQNPEYGLYTQGAVDPLLNVGLQDLNYFLNNDNPLEEAFYPSPVNHNFRNFGSSSGPSTSSPSNTNESLTPKSVSDRSSKEQGKPTTKERLLHHSNRMNLDHNKNIYVNEEILRSWLSVLPDVSYESMLQVFQAENETDGALNLANRMSYYLHAYWEVFHPKFSILHRPSFDTRTAQPFLIFAMICVGAMYCASPMEHSEERSLSEFKFCMLVAGPLRFKLFQHPHFKSPVKVWILQTLNLLEWSEKNYLLRHMHERAHIHHGTTVQLLHRSPFLGGNPENTQKHGTASTADSGVSGSEEDNSDAGVSIDIDHSETMDTDASLFEKWVESESMKRITFMTFYLDITDYIKFRHNPQVPFFQLQFLNLPCDDEKLWDCDEVNGSFKKLLKKQKSLQKPNSLGGASRSLEGVRAGMNFLTALKRLIKPSRANHSCRKLSMFTRAILVGGITSVMHQMQQAELQNSFTFLVSNARPKRSTFWKEFIVKALDNCEVQDLVSSSNSSSDSHFSVRKGQCRFPMYHLIHIIGLPEVNHYDIAIFGGSAQNMSVKATSKDYNIVKRKLTALWQPSSKQLSDMSNYRSVIHCYWLLWALMLKPLDSDENSTVHSSKYAWSIDRDYFDVMYPVSVAMLVLWSFTFTICGAESTKFDDIHMTFLLVDKMDLEQVNDLAAEDGYEYLYRIREQFKKHIENDGLTSDYFLHTAKSGGRHVPLHEVVSIYCGILPHIAFKESISGLCLLVGQELLKSQWEIVRENAKLIINCGLRSLGKTSIHCPDLFNED